MPAKAIPYLSIKKTHSMNAKKKREKRVYKQGLMNYDERAAYRKEKDAELLIKRRLRNKKDLGPTI